MCLIYFTPCQMQQQVRGGPPKSSDEMENREIERGSFDRTGGIEGENHKAGGETRMKNEPLHQVLFRCKR